MGRTHFPPPPTVFHHLPSLLSSEEDIYGPEYTSPEGSATCSSCVEESYMVNGRCERKPKGAETETEGTTLETLELGEGYFRFSKSSTEVYACKM